MTACPTSQHNVLPKNSPEKHRRPLHIGARQGKTFWEPAGPVVEAWPHLGPRISARAQTLAGPDAAFSIHMAMIGGSTETATPSIVFCVNDIALQRAIRNDGALNNILRGYPLSIAVDFCPTLPRFLAQDAASVEFPPDDGPVCSATPFSVWATEAAPTIGARLYVKCRDGGPPRMSTAGAVFFHRGKAFQTTVRHVFFKPESVPTDPHQPSFQNDLEMDGSDSDDFDHDSDDSIGDSMDGETFCHGEPDGTLHDGSSVPSSTQGPPSFNDEEETDGRHPSENGKDPEVPWGVFHIGTALPETIVGGQRAVDCALIEVQVSSDVDPNLVSYDPLDSTKKVRVTRPARMDKTPLSGTPVIVATSSRPVSGRLYKTLAYIKPRYQRDTVAVYPLVLDDDMSLEVGDCGSVVIQLKGSEVLMFGHVVFGHPGTAMAYILPMETIIDDMAELLSPDISLQPATYPKQKLGNSIRTEFASPKFYEDMKEVVMPEKHVIRGFLDKIVDKVGNTRTLMKRNRQMEVVNHGYSFEDLFFRLPPELRDQVIDFLNFREAMNLRHVSLRFRAAVSVNGSAISKRFLENNPLPPLAQKLYRKESPDLAHIHMVGHCHAVAWRLADHMVQWLRRDMFLYGSRFQRQQFQPKKVRMKQRLLPSLFLLGRFFEMCHDFLEEQVQSGADANSKADHIPITFPFKGQVMADCSDELLLQTHDVAVVLFTFLRRAMRPPSKYGSVERVLRHGSMKAPSDKEIAAVLYHGGLETMVNILDLEDLDKKAAAVRSYCASPHQPVEAVLKLSSSGRRRIGLNSESNGSVTITVTEKSQPLKLYPLLPRLPDLDHIWLPSAEAVLMERRVIRGRRDLNTFPVAMRELIPESETPADKLYKEGHDLWHALSDSEGRNMAHSVT